MTLTLNLPLELEQCLIQQANQQGLSVEALALQLLTDSLVSQHKPQQAVGLISEMAQQEADLMKPGESYPVWSPYDATQAANVLLKMLNTSHT
ncbi:MAG: hypothetical protein IGQ88_12895 [Gloeomargaritaceae cyanobacterium C42_A2020_066]|nr:hypothetical protein [Gloeomargaritaceae cyanobacterium C42_A2020_066]